jgi:hypothetical protein
MTMINPRVDLFTVIHKALRANLYEAGSLLERTDFGDNHERQRALSDLEQTLNFLEEHLSLEERYVVPLLRLASIEVGGALQAQHHQHELVTKRLRDLKKELAQCGGTGAVTLGVQLCKAYNKMLASQLTHMNEEEGPGNAALWSTQSDELLAATRAAMQAALPQTRYKEWLTIMVPLANHQELLGLFSTMKATAPPEVFEQTTAMAAELLGERWGKLKAALAN